MSCSTLIKASAVQSAPSTELDVIAGQEAYSLIFRNRLLGGPLSQVLDIVAAFFCRILYLVLVFIGACVVDQCPELMID